MEGRRSEQGFLYRGADLFLYLQVQTRSSKNGWVGLYQNRLKLKLTAPPVDHQANVACIEFLAKFLGAPKSTIEIIEGQTSRQKTVCITKYPPERWQLLFSQIVP